MQHSLASDVRVVGYREAVFRVGSIGFEGGWVRLAVPVVEVKCLKRHMVASVNSRTMIVAMSRDSKQLFDAGGYQSTHAASQLEGHRFDVAWQLWLRTGFAFSGGTASLKHFRVLTKSVLIARFTVFSSQSLNRFMV